MSAGRDLARRPQKNVHRGGVFASGDVLARAIRATGPSMSVVAVDRGGSLGKWTVSSAGNKRASEHALRWPHPKVRRARAESV